MCSHRRGRSSQAPRSSRRRSPASGCRPSEPSHRLPAIVGLPRNRPVTCSFRSNGISRQVSRSRCAVSINEPQNSWLRSLTRFRERTPLGHYYVATAGNIDARGWSVGMTQEVPGYLRGKIEYMVAAAYWSQLADDAIMRAVRSLPLSAEKVHDLQTSVEATIPKTATRLYATYRINTAFSSDDPDVFLRSANARFNVRRESGPSLPAFFERRLGGARGCSEHLPRGGCRSLHLRRGPRHQGAYAHRRRLAGQVLETGRLFLRPATWPRLW